MARPCSGVQLPTNIFATGWLLFVLNNWQQQYTE